MLKLINERELGNKNQSAFRKYAHKKTQDRQYLEIPHEQEMEYRKYADKLPMKHFTAFLTTITHAMVLENIIYDKHDKQFILYLDEKFANDYTIDQIIAIFSVSSLQMHIDDSHFNKITYNIILDAETLVALPSDHDTFLELDKKNKAFIWRPSIRESKDLNGINLLKTFMSLFVILIFILLIISYY
jgi:hypothetical protein